MSYMSYTYMSHISVYSMHSISAQYVCSAFKVHTVRNYTCYGSQITHIVLNVAVLSFTMFEFQKVCINIQ